MPRRTIDELLDIYSKYKKLIPQQLSTTELSKRLNINANTIIKWNNGAKPSHKLKDKSGTTFGRWKILNYEGKQLYKCRCIDCKSTRLLSTNQVNNEINIACRICEPLLNFETTQQLSDLYNQEISPSEITKVLDLTSNQYRLHYTSARQNQLIFPETYELSFTEIAKVLDITPESVKHILKSALRKIKITPQLTAYRKVSGIKDTAY